MITLAWGALTLICIAAFGLGAGAALYGLWCVGYWLYALVIRR